MLKIGNRQFILYNALYSVITLSISLMFFPIEVECKEIEVSAVVSPRFIQYNEKATLELTISGKTQINHIGSPQFNFLPNFLAVPLESKTIPRLVDNKVAVSMAWVYELIPQKIGEIDLPDISFLYQGIPYIANPGKIIVGATDTYYNTSTGGMHKVVAEVDNNKPYIHEGIVYRFRYLYTTVLPTVEPPTPSLPSFSGFVVEELNDKNTTEKIGGKIYYVQEYVRRLYPQNLGQILVYPSELILHLKGNPKTLKTKHIPLNVQPLPINSKPTNFSGAVGDFSISAQLDRNRLAVRNAITLSLKINGNGNLKNITPPNLSSIHGFRVNPPKQVKVDTSNNLNINYVLVPIKAGRLQIPAITFSFFNPSTKTYQTTKTLPIPITVIPNTSDVPDSGSSFSNWTVWFLIISLVGVFIAAGFLLFRSKLKHKLGSSFTENSATFSQTAPDSIVSLDNVTIEMKSTSFGEELTRILHQALCNMINKPYRQLSIAEVQELCNHVNVSQSIIEEIEVILTRCEYHRFAPVPLSNEEREDLITRLKNVIQNLEAS